MIIACDLCSQLKWRNILNLDHIYSTVNNYKFIYIFIIFTRKKQR